MLNKEKKARAIVQARKIAAKTLLNSLQKLSQKKISEKVLANHWIDEIQKNSLVRNSGWYVPPQNGLSVLIGNAPNYTRLNYESLRTSENWPNEKNYFLEESILYPYFSVVDKETLLLGDFVGTFYGGKNKKIIDWIKTVYHATIQISEFVETGKKVSDIYKYAQEILNNLGAKNNTYSQCGGVSSDIGHSIPGFEKNFLVDAREIKNEEVAKLISENRWFVSADNHKILGEDYALTIEPQMIAEKLPMVSFHVIVVSVGNKKRIITEFDKLFEFFGMKLD